MATSTPDHAMGTTTPLHRVGIDGHPVPRLRGRLHQLAVIPLGLTGAVFALRAPTALETTAMAIFTVSVVAMLVASAAYHCHAGSFERKLAARRLDHAMIFVAIAGTQTAYWLLSAPARTAVIALAVVWVIAGFGIRHKLTRLTLTHSVGSWLYIALGWTGIVMVPYLLSVGDAVAFLAVVGGGLVYSGGGLVLSHRIIDPWPGVFGYHEVWHTMVVMGVLAHGFGIVRLAATVA